MDQNKPAAGEEKQFEGKNNGKNKAKIKVK